MQSNHGERTRNSFFYTLLYKAGVQKDQLPLALGKADMKDPGGKEEQKAGLATSVNSQRESLKSLGKQVGCFSRRQQSSN